MYAKLALRNMKRSRRDYLIYMLTVILTVTLMYAFLALGFSENILSMSENMSMLTTGVLALSIFVALISSFVISYAVRFMLGQRKKEFATYELLGMEIGAIQRLFLLENGVLGIGAFFAGILLGTGLSGIFAGIVKNIFDTPHSYRITFSRRAFFLSLLLFAAMYGIGILRAARIIRSRKIVELLYDGHRNEETKYRSAGRCAVVAGLSLLAMLAGGVLAGQGITLQTNTAWLYFGAAAVLLLLGVYGIYRNLPFMLITFAKRNIRRKYSGGNLFYYGQIGHRLQSCGRMMAATAILLTVSLSTTFVGLAMGSGYKANMEAYYPYDAGVAIDAPLTRESFHPLVSYVNKKAHVEKSIVYYLYTVRNYPIEALSLSDYNSLRTVLGLEEVKLQEDEYLVHCDTWNYQKQIEARLEKQPEIHLAGRTLKNSGGRILTEPMEQYQMAGTKGYVLVIPDDTASLLPGGKIRLVMKLADHGYPELKDEIDQFLNSAGWEPDLQTGAVLPEKVTLGITVKAWGVDNSLTGFTVLSFCGLYMSIVFILLSCTILAFEQLSAIDRNRKGYQMLGKLGVSKKMQNSLMRRELSVFFFLPLILPAVVMFLLVAGVQNLFGNFILQKGVIPMSGVIAFLVLGVIYFVYYLTTYYLFRRNMELS